MNGEWPWENKDGGNATGKRFLMLFNII